jgi:hypothetical protein
MQHLIVRHINLHVTEGFTMGNRYRSTRLVFAFDTIFVFVYNDVLARIFARNVLRIGLLLFVRQPLHNIVFVAARCKGEQ